MRTSRFGRWVAVGLVVATLGLGSGWTTRGSQTDPGGPVRTNDSTWAAPSLR